MSTQSMNMKATKLGVTGHGFGTSPYPCITFHHVARNSHGFFSLTIEEAAEFARTIAELVMQAQAAQGARVA